MKSNDDGGVPVWIMVVCGVFFVVAALLSFAVDGICGDEEWEPLGSTVQYKDTVAGVSSFTLPTTGKVYTAYVTVEGGNIRYFYDKTNPAGQYGHIGIQNSGIECRSLGEADGFRFTLDSTASGVTVTATFFGKRR